MDLEYILQIERQATTQLDLIRSLTEGQYGALEGYHSRDAEVEALQARIAELQASKGRAEMSA